MFCKHGMWVDFLGSPIEKIECATASWCLVLLLLLIAAALGACVAFAQQNKHGGLGMSGAGRSASTLGSSSEDVAAALHQATTRDLMEAAEPDATHEQPPAPAPHETEGEL